MKTIVAFGEIMGRFCPENFQRFRQAMPGRLDLTFAGAEANVAASIAMLGGKVKYITALPKNELSESCIAQLKSLNIDVSGIRLTDEGRMGLYFVERGANQRPSRVVYDREYSSISMTSADEYAWDDLWGEADWFHTTGITPSLSEIAAKATEKAILSARAKGLSISYDLNFRKKLWKWKPGTDPQTLARKTTEGLLPHVGLVIGNEADARDVLGIKAAHSDVEKGELDVKAYTEVAKEIHKRFPNVRLVAITLRESISATHNNWGAMLYDTASGMVHLAPGAGDSFEPYEIRNIVDRVGTGDSFAAALIFALNTPDISAPAEALNFAVASSCLCHSINGDFNYSTRQEVEALVQGFGSGRVVR